MPPCINLTKTFQILATILVLLAFAMMAIPGFQLSIVLCFAFAALLVLMHVLLKHPTSTTIITLKIFCILLTIKTLAVTITIILIVRTTHPNKLESCDSIVVMGAGVRDSAPSCSRQTRTGIVSSECRLFRTGLFARPLGMESTGIPATTFWFALRLNYYLYKIAAVWKYQVLRP